MTTQTNAIAMLDDVKQPTTQETFMFVLEDTLRRWPKFTMDQKKCLIDVFEKLLQAAVEMTRGRIPLWEAVLAQEEGSQITKPPADLVSDVSAVVASKCDEVVDTVEALLRKPQRESVAMLRAVRDVAIVMRKDIVFCKSYIMMEAYRNDPLFLPVIVALFYEECISDEYNWIFKLLKIFRCPEEQSSHQMTRGEVSGDVISREMGSQGGTENNSECSASDTGDCSLGGTEDSEGDSASLAPMTD